MPKDELWGYLNKQRVKENHGFDESAYMHAKLKAVEVSRKLLESRINASRFAVMNAQIGNLTWRTISKCFRHTYVYNLVYLLDFFFYRFEEFKCPELLVNHYKPTSCCIRMWIMKHALVLLPVCALVLHINTAFKSLY